MFIYFGNNHIYNGHSNQYLKKFKKLVTIFTVTRNKNPIIRLFSCIIFVIFNLNQIKAVIVELYSGKSFYSSMILCSILNILSIKYILVHHGGNLDKKIRKRSLLLTYLVRNAFKNITPSRFLVDTYKQHDMKIKYIPNFVDNRHEFFKKRVQVELKLLWVRAFHEIYNPIMAIELINFIKKSGYKVELLMIGPDMKDGSKEKCLNLVKNYDLASEVSFKGRVPKNEWLKLSKKYDIFVNTTNIESFGISNIEAISCGLVLATTNSGELKYIFEDNKNCILVDKNDPEMMSKRLINLINEQHLIVDIIKNSQLILKSFLWENVKSEWLSVFNSIDIED